MNESEYIAGYCLKDTLNFTRYMFLSNNKKAFLVGRHHRLICDKLNEVIDGKCKRLIINIAPRYGKTELAVKNFIAAGLAFNPKAKFIHLSYSNTLAQDNSIAIKEIVNSEEYQRLFPGTKVKYGSDTKSRWDTEEGGGVYATSTLGQITGFGAGAIEYEGEERMFSGAIIIDDPIKPEDALSDNEREKVNRRFETTIRNRVNSRNTPIIIIMQRLHEHDLCGYLNEIEPGEWDVLSLPSIYQDEEGNECSLWSDMHTVEELRKLERNNQFVFETQYMQNPTPMEGLMYGKFKTYKEIPYTNRAIRKNYTDTADTGSDYLCSIDYIDTEIGNFILDVVYTSEPMEVTEPLVAGILTRDSITVANIESNNGGRGFARNVENQCRILGNGSTSFNWFHQSANKETRIFTRSSEVMNLTYFPEGWESRFPAFAAELKSFRKFGKNAHDDGSDCLTGTIEKRGEFDFEGFVREDVELTGTAYVEIHPLINGKFVMARGYQVDGKVYVDYGYIGEGISVNDAADMCIDADVHIEVSKSNTHYLSDFKQHMDVWGRKERTDKLPYILSFKSMVAKDFVFAREKEMEGFMRNMMDYDGKDVYEAMYVMCRLADRLKRQRI